MVEEILTYLNWVDILVVIILIITSYVGFRRGLAGEILRIAGVILALLVAFTYANSCGEFISRPSFISPDIGRFMAFLLLAVITGIICRLLRKGIEKIIQMSILGWLDKAGGVLFGAGKGVIVAGLLIFLLHLLSLSYLRNSIEENSFSGKYLLKVPPAIYNLITRTEFKLALSETDRAE